MSQISFRLSDVDLSDTENIARYVEVPSMQNGPLYRTMVPLSGTITDAQRDEITRWYIDMLKDAFQDRTESSLKAQHLNSNVPVGFCGWTIIKQNDKRVEAKEKSKKGSWLPGVIDVNAWVTLSGDLRVERNRDLENLDNICRLTFMAVNPKYQRQGIAPEGARLYEKFGFEIVGRVKTPYGAITSMLRPSRQ
ncbi:acyl-CoA N-acyltransferase [Camillea tinctor]|nr:acyl-CoA N-acyltransferase [Camillea tinctor]